MIKNFLIITLLFLYSSKASTDNDGFGKQIFEEPPPKEKGESITEETNENIVDENLHPLLRYDLNKYLVIGTVLELTNDKRTLAIIKAPGESIHVVFLEDILSNDESPWIIKKINLRGITVQKVNAESAKDLDENGNLIFLEKQIDVNNSTINLTEMNNN